MKFTKMQGAGNDYVYLDARDMERDWASLSVAISDRHFGVGGDGIIVIQNSDVAQLRMRIFNTDGSEGEMCGNGIRCVAKYAIDRKIAQPSTEGISIETLAGVRTVQVIKDRGQIVGARVAMGEPIFAPVDVPVDLPSSAGGSEDSPVLEYPVEIGGAALNLSFISMGNPHAVAFIDQPVDEFPLHTVGPQVEHHSMFPNRVNFEIVNIRNKHSLVARVWERGSGETLACGSGASAIGVASYLLGHTEEFVDIKLPGGMLNISWAGKGDVYMEGPAEEVFEGEWPEPE